MLRLLSRRVPLCKAIIYFSVEIHLTGRKDRYDIFGVSESKGEKKKRHIKIFAKYLDLFCNSSNYHYICSAIRCEFIDRKEEAPHGEGLYPGRDSPPNKSLSEMITSKTISFAFFWGLIRFRIRKTYKK